MNTTRNKTITNVICSHATLLACFLGVVSMTGLILIIASITIGTNQFISSFEIVPLIAFVLSIIGFGCLIGLAILWSSIRKICSKINGAPYRVMDDVLILVGGNKNKKGKVFELAKSQGGWVVLYVNINEDAEKQLLEEYEVMKIEP